MPPALNSPVNRLGRFQHFELTVWVRPLIFDRVRKQDRARNAQGHQAMLIKGQFVRMFIE